jgi:hypothetical protein
MKNLILIVLIIGTLNACSKKESESTNKWRLIEQLSDPGDGSGVFMPVVSDRTIEFFDDSTIVSNGNLCSLDIGSNQETTGTYSETDGYIYPDGCMEVDFKISYEISGDELILSYFCIEPCRHKYLKID